MKAQQQHAWLSLSERFSKGMQVSGSDAALACYPADTCLVLVGLCHWEKKGEDLHYYSWWSILRYPALWAFPLSP